MAWCRIGDKLLSELMLTWCTDAYMRHSVRWVKLGVVTSEQMAAILTDGISKCVFLMTSSNGSIFRVTGPLWGEFTGGWWIPLTKASDAQLWCFLWYTFDKRLRKQSKRQWFETPSCSLWLHCNGFHFIWSLFARVPLTRSQHWKKYLSPNSYYMYLNLWWSTSLTHICVRRTQRVNPLFGTKPLFEPMPTRFTDAYMRH